MNKVCFIWALLQCYACSRAAAAIFWAQPVGSSYSGKFQGCAQKDNPLWH